MDALLAAACNPDADGRIFNLGGEKVYSLAETAQILVNANGTGRFMVRQFPEDRKKIDIGDYYSDFTSIRETLGWQPAIDLKEWTIPYFDIL